MRVSIRDLVIDEALRREKGRREQEQEQEHVLRLPLPVPPNDWTPEQSEDTPKSSVIIIQM